MIALPHLGRSPASYTATSTNPVAARCALKIAPAGPIAPLRGRKLPLEFAHLAHYLEAFMERAAKGLEIFEPKIHFCLDRAPDCDHTFSDDASVAPGSIWLMNRNGDSWHTRWHLQRRWKELAKQAPGMGATALSAIDRTSYAGLLVYTPFRALQYCSWHHWMGEDDDEYARAEWSESDGKEIDLDKAEEQGFPTRRWIEKKMPPIAKENSRRIGRERLEQSWGPRRDIARAILELEEAAKARRTRSASILHREDEQFCCVGYGATLRWNADDPMPQFFDDYANGMCESHNVEPHFGWLPMKDPVKQLPAVLEAIEARFAVARATEKLIQLIAERKAE